MRASLNACGIFPVVIIWLTKNRRAFVSGSPQVFRHSQQMLPRPGLFPSFTVFMAVSISIFRIAGIPSSEESSIGELSESSA